MKSGKRTYKKIQKKKCEQQLVRQPEEDEGSSQRMQDFRSTGGSVG